MRVKNAENIEQTISSTATQHQIVLQEGDIQAFRKAYLKFGDIDLALNNEGDVLSDVMEADHLDIIAEALTKEFGLQGHDYPEQIYTVKINGNSYKTYLDDFGEQRFLGNKILNHCAITNLDYEKEKELYQTGQYTIDEWVEFNAIIGSHLKEFLLTVITCLDIENPRDMR